MNVSEFGPAPRDDPWCYPGRRPEFSYLFQNGTISAMLPGGRGIGDMHVDDTSLDERLDDLGAAPMSERYAIVGYGSNANPAQLYKKFGDTVIPVVRGRLYDYDVTYACSLAPYGSIPATISVSREADVEVWVTFLTDPQLDIMDESEGRNKSYELVRLQSTVTMDGGISENPVTYVHMYGAIGLGPGVRRLSSIPVQNTSFSPMSQPKAIKKVARMLGITPEELVKNPLNYRATVESWDGARDRHTDVLSGTTRPPRFRSSW